MVPEEIVNAVLAAGGQCFAVGGCVRDLLLGHDSKDIDVEVFGIEAQQLVGVLENFGRVNQVGVSFGVIKLKTADHIEFDFTLPRRENKAGRGHRGFQVQVDHTLTPEAAALRRDFTINAISRCLTTGKIRDPLGGCADLERRILRATGPQFAEDPLRVLRGMQFAARFNMELEQETATLCQTLLEEHTTLSTERIWGEWQKWALRGSHPGQGLRVLHQTGWLSAFPELAALIDVPQDPEWHPEGDVWTHTLHVCDEAALIADRDSITGHEREVLMFAALCHDFGKAVTTEEIDGRWKAHGHCETGVPIARSFLERIGCPESVIEQVEPLVAEHLAHSAPNVTPRMVRRLARRLGKASVTQLIRLIEADLSGRPPLPRGLPDRVRQIEELAQEVGVQQTGPKPIIQGRHLIQLGHEPDVWFGDILNRCFEAQLDGTFTSEDKGMEYLETLLKLSQ